MTETLLETKTPDSPLAKGVPRKAKTSDVEAAEDTTRTTGDDATGAAQVSI